MHNPQCVHRARISTDVSASVYECFLSRDRKTPNPSSRTSGHKDDMPTYRSSGLPRAKDDWRDLREGRVRIRCKMPQSSKGRPRIVIDKAAFSAVTETVTGAPAGLSCCLAKHE